MKSKSKIAEFFEIKRPIKINMKKVENDIPRSDDKLSKNNKRLFVKNESSSKFQDSKYTRINNDIYCSENTISVKKIAEEYEKKWHKPIQNSHCEETILLDNPHTQTTHINMYDNTSLNSFLVAKDQKEQDICRKNLVDEINFHVANMQSDGFIDENENELIDNDNSDIEVCDLQQSNLFPLTVMDQPSARHDVNVNYFKHRFDNYENENGKLPTQKTYIDDDFSESLGDDLENGAVIAEAYNDEGRELILVQIILDRKVINLDSSQSIKEAIDEAEFVFYENEEQTLCTDNLFVYENNDHEQSVRESNEYCEISEFVFPETPNITIGEENQSNIFETFYEPSDSKTSTQRSVTSNKSLVNDIGEEENSLQNYEDSSYNNMRRETFCDLQGVVRIERVGYPEKYRISSNDEYTLTLLSRNNSVASTKRLDFIVDELKVTEKKYVNDLSKVVHIYRPYVQKRTSSHHQSTIFGNIKKIYKGQKKFLNELENCQGNAEEIAAVFINFESLFDLYPAYLKNKPKADILLKDHNTILKQMQEEYEERLDFSAYLLTPLQRLGKYILFLENIEKELQELQLSTKNTQLALNIIKNCMSQGNDYVAIESIQNSPISKFDYGSFIMREIFIIIKPRRYESMVFLFSNVIVFTITDEKTSDTFNYVDSIKMNDLRIATFENGTIHLSDFTKGKKKRNTVKYTYILETKTEKLRDSWREAIENILWQQLKNARENSLKIGGTLGKKYKERTKSTGSAVFYVDQPAEESLKKWQ